MYSRGFDVLIAPNYLIFSSCSSVYSVIHILSFDRLSENIWLIIQVIYDTQKNFFVCILIRTIQFHISPFIMFNFIDICVMCSYWVYQIDFNFVWMTRIEIWSDKKTDLISFLFYIPYIFLTFGILIFFSVNVYYIIMYVKILICVWNGRFISVNHRNVEADWLKYNLKPASTCIKLIIDLFPEIKKWSFLSSCASF